MWHLRPLSPSYTNRTHAAGAAAAKSLQSCPTLCDPIEGSLPGSPSLGFSREEHWSGLPFPSPMHESEKWKWSRSVMSDFATPWTATYQAPPPMGFSRQEYWSWLPLLSPETSINTQKDWFLRVSRLAWKLVTFSHSLPYALSFIWLSLSYILS